jgi:hypothetical protein
MRVKHLIILITLITRFSYGQNLNVVIQVNEKLVVSEIAGAKLNFKNIDQTVSSTQVGYHPGELILDDESWTKLKSDSTQKISLTFDFYTYKGTQQQIRNYCIEMDKYHFDKPYLIINIYDFRERKYRKRYSCLTDNDFIAEIYFPQGGILIECK